MSPKREMDETRTANPDAKVAEEAAEAKAEQAKPRRRRRKADAEPGPEATATAEQQDKPRRRRRRRKGDDEDGEASDAGRQASEETAEPSAEATDEEPQAQEPEDEQAEETPAPARSPKPEARRPSADGAVLVRARARYVRTSARKARLVCDHIRGKSVPEARAILGFTPRAAARDWAKVLESAIANAEANHELIGDELKVAEAYADEGPTLKRYRPRAMGRATRIRKRTAHLTITLAPAANGSKERSR
jgi:ribosomal protein L22